MMWLLCFFGGIGAMARYVLDVSIQRSWNRSFPLSTLVINGIASLCAGIAMMSYYAQSVDSQTVMLFLTGFLGGFSTFSTAINEVLSLIRKKRFAMALGYGVATVAVPLVCVALFSDWLRSPVDKRQARQNVRCARMPKNRAKTLFCRQSCPIFRQRLTIPAP